MLTINKQFFCGSWGYERRSYIPAHQLITRKNLQNQLTQVYVFFL